MTAPAPDLGELARLEAAARHEIAEDRRIAALMREPKNRAALERRAAVTEALVEAVERVRELCESAEMERDAQPFADEIPAVLTSDEVRRALDGASDATD